MEEAPDASLMLKDRLDAGRRLAERLERFRGENPVVIGAHRGSTPVAFEVSRILNAPLDVLIVREISAPDARGRIVGAVAEGRVKVMGSFGVETTGNEGSDLTPEVDRLFHEVQEAGAKYRQGRPPIDLAGRTAILVAAGISHALAMRAVIDSARVRGAQRLIAAIGVCPRETAQEIRRHCDEAVVLRQPQFLLSVGEWFSEYPKVTEEEIINYLRAAHLRHSTAGNV